MVAMADGIVTPGNLAAPELAAYRSFLEAKAKLSTDAGFPCDPSEAHSLLKPHQRDIVASAVRGGRRAVFTA